MSNATSTIQLDIYFFSYLGIFEFLNFNQKLFQTLHQSQYDENKQERVKCDGVVTGAGTAGLAT
jgi:hypothetical protein